MPKQLMNTICRFESVCVCTRCTLYGVQCTMAKGLIGYNDLSTQQIVFPLKNLLTTNYRVKPHKLCIAIYFAYTRSPRVFLIA